jgi:hypothetical protein
MKQVLSVHQYDQGRTYETAGSPAILNSPRLVAEQDTHADEACDYDRSRNNSIPQSLNYDCEQRKAAHQRHHFLPDTVRQSTDEFCSVILLGQFALTHTCSLVSQTDAARKAVVEELRRFLEGALIKKLWLMRSRRSSRRSLYKFVLIMCHRQGSAREFSAEHREKPRKISELVRCETGNSPELRNRSWYLHF